MQKLKPVMTAATMMLVSACVHTQIERTGRAHLGGGNEGVVRVLAAMPAGYQEVAVITISASSFGTEQRLKRHLLRRASLLGCEAIVGLVVKVDANARGTCIQRGEPSYEVPTIVLDAAPTLLVRAADAGPAGEALLQVIDQMNSRPASERSWPLKWYLKTYPDSPFYDDVAALLRGPVPSGSQATASVRMAP